MVDSLLIDPNEGFLAKLLEPVLELLLVGFLVELGANLLAVFLSRRVSDHFLFGDLDDVETARRWKHPRNLASGKLRDHGFELFRQLPRLESTEYAAWLEIGILADFISELLECSSGLKPLQC